MKSNLNFRTRERERERKYKNVYISFHFFFNSSEVSLAYFSYTTVFGCIFRSFLFPWNFLMKSKYLNLKFVIGIIKLKTKWRTHKDGACKKLRKRATKRTHSTTPKVGVGWKIVARCSSLVKKWEKKNKPLIYIYVYGTVRTFLSLFLSLLAQCL